MTSLVNHDLFFCIFHTQKTKNFPDFWASLLACLSLQFSCLTRLKPSLTVSSSTGKKYFRPKNRTENLCYLRMGGGGSGAVSFLKVVANNFDVLAGYHQLLLSCFFVNSYSLLQLLDSHLWYLVPKKLWVFPFFLGPKWWYFCNFFICLGFYWRMG